jgi:hypothetical protein
VGDTPWRLCQKCRSEGSPTEAGSLLELKVTLESNPRGLDDLTDWSIIRHFGRLLWGYSVFDAKPLELVLDWLAAEHGKNRYEALFMQRSEVAALLQAAVGAKGLFVTPPADRAEEGEGTPPSDKQVPAAFRLACNAVCGCISNLEELRLICQPYQQDGAGKWHCDGIAGTLLRLTYHLNRAKRIYPTIAWTIRTLYTEPPEPVAGVSGATYHEIGIGLADQAVWRIATTAKLGRELLDTIATLDLSDADLWKLLNTQRAQIVAKVCINRDEGQYPWRQWSEALDSLPVFDADNLMARVKIEAAHSAQRAIEALGSQSKGTGGAGSAKGLEIMADVSLTEAVCYAVGAADSIVRIYSDQTYPDAPGHFRGFLEALDKWLKASNGLVKQAGEFRGHYAMPPDSIAGLSAPSYHELGRRLALEVFDGVWRAVVFSDPERAAALAQQPIDFDLLAGNLPIVTAYLRNEAPRFDAGRLVAMIQDEAVKAAKGMAPRTEFHYHDYSIHIQGGVQGSNVAAGGSNIAGSSASYNSSEELVEALKALTPLIRSATECQEDVVAGAIAVLVRAASDPSVPATEVEQAASVVATSSPTLRQRLGDIAGRIGVSLTGSAIFQAIKMAFGIH